MGIDTAAILHWEINSVFFVLDINFLRFWNHILRHHNIIFKLNNLMRIIYVRLPNFDRSTPKKFYRKIFTTGWVIVIFRCADYYWKFRLHVAGCNEKEGESQRGELNSRRQIDWQLCTPLLHACGRRPTPEGLYIGGVSAGFVRHFECQNCNFRRK